jgi:mRNA-degrading endonuclease RelE of RelBE toxin-antitoxin system
MNLKLIPTPEFKISVKKLSKRYALIAKDLKTLKEELENNPTSGVHLYNNCYKIRLKNSSVPTGKSGGFRVIYFLRQEEKIYLLAIYSNSDMENIDESRLKEILKSNGL